MAAGIDVRWTPNLQQHYRHRIKPTIGVAHILDGVLSAAPPSSDG